MRNLLLAFDDFSGKEILSDRDFQDYLGRYQDLRDEWKNNTQNGEKASILDDVVFEIELIKQIEINIDYILALVKKYCDSHCKNKEILVDIRKAVEASPELRSKKELIHNFISKINQQTDDVITEWRSYVKEEQEKELTSIIQTEQLNEENTRKFIQNAFRDGEIKTSGTNIDALMPPISRFGESNRATKKKGIIAKLRDFFNRFLDT